MFQVGYIFGGMGVLGFLWTWWFLPDTKNRSLEELDELFLNVKTKETFQYTLLDTDKHDRKYLSGTGPHISVPVTFNLNIKRFQLPKRLKLTSFNLI